MKRVFKKWNAVALVLFLALTACAPTFSFAATVTDAYNQITSLEPSGSANHLFVVTIADEVAEGETFVLTFPSDFDTSSIVEDDVDVEDDSVDLTTAANCSGSEEASVAIASDVVTITICAGDGGTIASGSVVEVEIGTNATASGTGANQIVNPSGAGTYFVDVSGTFGGSGSVPIPIVSNAGGTVSGTVPCTGCGSGSGGGGSSTTTYSVTVNDPNGGETLSYGGTHSIQWSNSVGVANVTIDYSIDNGGSWTNLVTNTTNLGSYTWTIPNVNTTEALVRVFGLDSGGSSLASDASDAVFEIVGDAYEVEVTDPNGGEEIEGGSTYTVTWTTSATVHEINLAYSLDSGASYTTIATSETNDGEYEWTVPDSATDQALIRIQGLDFSGTIQVADASDDVFSIVTDEDEEEEGEDPEEEEEGETEETEESDGEDSEEGGEEGAEEGTEAGEEGDTEGEGADDEEGTDEGSGEDDEETEEIGEEEASQDREADAVLVTGDEGVEIEPSGSGAFDVFSGTETEIIVTLSEPEDVTRARVTYGDGTYPLTRNDDGTYSTFIPIGDSTQRLEVVAEYGDGTTARQDFTVRIRDLGLVYEVTDQATVPVAGAVVIVYELHGGTRTQWDAARYGQANPFITTAPGAIGWYVPNGTYVVTVGKSGYEDASRVVSVFNNILAPSIEIAREPEDIVDEVVVPSEEQDAEGGLPQQVQEVLDAVFATLAEVRKQPEVQTAATIGSAASITAATASVVVLGSSFHLLRFLQYLVTSPVLFFARRRRQNFGVVYNAATKVPVDLAIVRLYTEQRKLVRTMVTDQEGRYFFKVNPGRYGLEVIKEGFEFPSVYLKGVRQDGKRLDVYTGGVIEVTDKDVTITANVPLDPSGAEKFHKPSSLLLRRFTRVLQQMVAPLGVLLSLFVLMIFPNLLNVVMVVVQVVFYALTLKLARPEKRRGWGIVSDGSSKKPLTNTVVRLFESKYNKLLETTVTDRKGRYAFLVGENNYFVTFEKPGYASQELRPIDYTAKEEPTPISVDVALKKAT